MRTEEERGEESFQRERDTQTHKHAQLQSLSRTPDLSDWNERYQGIQKELLLLLTGQETEEVGGNERIVKGVREYQMINVELIHLVQDFLNVSTTYGRIIIQERYLESPLKVWGMHFCFAF